MKFVWQISHTLANVASYYLPKRHKLVFLKQKRACKNSSGSQTCKLFCVWWFNRTLSILVLYDKRHKNRLYIHTNDLMNMTEILWTWPKHWQISCGNPWHVCHHPANSIIPVLCFLSYFSIGNLKPNIEVA